MLECKAVAFDLGGVMIRIYHEWSGALVAAGFPPRPELGGLGGFREFDLYQKGAIGDNEFLSRLALFLDLDSEGAARVHMAVLRDQYPGVDLLVQELANSGIVCGCLSNTNSLHWATFFDGTRYPFGPLLQVRVGSQIVGANKPDPAMFAAFEAQSGFAGNDVVYFDDGPANVAAARDFGWQAWVIDPASDTCAQMRELLRL